MPASQEHRSVKVTCPLGDNVLLFHRMSGSEAVSEPFEVRLDLLSANPAIDGDALLGKTMTVALDLPPGGVRHINGHVCRFSQAGCTAIRRPCGPGCGC